MGWLQSRRLRYGVGASGLVFLLLALLRLVFVLGFSGVDSAHLSTTRNCAKPSASVCVSTCVWPCC